MYDKFEIPCDLLFKYKSVVCSAVSHMYVWSHI